MKSLGAVRHKFKQAAFRHLKKRLADSLAVRPGNCIFNVQKPRADGKVVGFCRCPAFTDEQWPGECDGVLTPDRPQRCGQFKPLDKDALKDEFRDFLSEAPLHEVASEYPDLAALLWVLGEDASAREAAMGPETEWPQNEPEPEPEPEAPPPVTVEVLGVPVQVVDESAAEKFRAHLEGLVQGFRDEITTAKEASEGYREVADKLQAEKAALEAALQKKQEEAGVDAVLLRKAHASVALLENQVATLMQEQTATPVVVSRDVPAPLITPEVPQGFWARLRYLFGGAPS